MGWSFRKSIGLGPFRVNISKSGIGYSVGAMGFRTGVNARGRSYKSMSIPGTGLRYTPSGGKGCVGGVLLMLVVVATSIGGIVWWRS